jgi:hypothetical protein
LELLAIPWKAAFRSEKWIWISLDSLVRNRAFSIGCEVPEEKERKIFSAPPPSSNARSGRVQRTLATEASGAHDGIVYRVLIFSKLLLQKLSKSENNQAAPGRVASNAGDKGSNR